MNNTLKILSEMQRTEISHQKIRVLISLLTITDSQPHDPTIMTTLLVEVSSSTDIFSPSVEDQIDSFVLSNIENDKNSLETLVILVIYNAFNYVKCKKLRESY